MLLKNNMGSITGSLSVSADHSTTDSGSWFPALAYRLASLATLRVSSSRSSGVMPVMPVVSAADSASVSAVEIPTGYGEVEPSLAVGLSLDSPASAPSSESVLED